jgi:hypothetical protein
VYSKFVSELCCVDVEAAELLWFAALFSVAAPVAVAALFAVLFAVLFAALFAVAAPCVFSFCGAHAPASIASATTKAKTIVVKIALVLSQRLKHRLKL